MLTLALLAAGCASNASAPISYRADAPPRAPASEAERGSEARPRQRAEIEYHSPGLAERHAEANAPARAPDRVEGEGVGAYALNAEETQPFADTDSRADADTAVAAELAGARFQMPLEGPVTARFGAQPGGVWLDGIEIAGREGDAITAAAAGEVVYAGADLPAYGTLVLLRHEDNYVTAYAFARRALVREGQRVRAGQRIAELGLRADGGARLLFQVRRGGEATNPAPLLGIGG